MKTKSAPGSLTCSLLLGLVACFGSACGSQPPAQAPAQAPAAPEASVKPGINKPFLDPNLDVDAFVARFEGESREVFANRAEIVAAIGLKNGQAMVDVGAGTGPFIGLFAQAVGSGGKVYAVDIAPNFVAHLAERAKSEGHPQIEARACSETSVELPAASINLAFICDVYHHFEFPRTSMTSIHSALRPGGEVIIVDFERVPGETSDWVLKHVRAGKQEVIAELNSYGFDFIEELAIDGLEDNYACRFRKR